MIWLTWRQHRRQALFAVVGLAVIAALMLPTGRQMHAAFVDSGLPDCLRAVERAEFLPVDRGADQRRCETLANGFTTRFGSLGPLAILFVFLPLLVGLFFGAPLVAREVEQGTHRLVWTQGVTRGRWSAAKIGVVGASALLLAAAYTALLTWWIAPGNQATGSRLGFLIFDLQGVVPVAYTLFAVSLGIFAGAAARRVLPAMAITLVGFVGVRLAVAALARPHFLPERRRTFAVAGESEPNRLLGDWVLSQGVYGADGRLVADDSMSLCSPPEPGATTPDPCLATYGAGAYNQQIYQPGSRFWMFQYIEAGVFIALAALLLALAIHLIRRRIS